MIYDNFIVDDWFMTNYLLMFNLWLSDHPFSWCQLSVISLPPWRFLASKTRKGEKRRDACDNHELKSPLGSNPYLPLKMILLKTQSSKFILAYINLCFHPYYMSQPSSPPPTPSNSFECADMSYCQYNIAVVLIFIKYSMILVLSCLLCLHWCSLLQYALCHSQGL